MAVNPDILAYGRVVIEIAENIQRDMAKAEAEVERGLKRLERKEAELKITADDRQFVTKMRAAQARAIKAQEDIAKATDAAERKNAKSRLNRANATLKALEGANVKLHNKLVQLDEDRAALQEKIARQRADGERKLTRAVAREEEKRAKAAEVAAERQRKAEEKAAAEAVRTEQKRIAESNKLRTREVNRRIADAVKAQQQITRIETKALNDRVALETKSHNAINRQRAQAQRQMQADMQQTAALQARYITLMEKRQRLALQRSKLFTTGNRRIQLDVDLKHIDQQAEAVKARLEAIDEPPPIIDLEIDDRGSAALSKWAKLITDTSVRIGPFTTSIGGATRALALFGPVVIGAAGALGALAGVLGSGAFGVLGTLTAGTLGFGAALGGVGLLMPKLLNDFKNLNTLQDAYHKQVLKTGANSEKAKTKLKEFEHALGEVPPTTLATFEALDQLNKRWDRLAKRAAPTFFENIAAGVDMANKNFEMFGNETLESFEIVSDGWKTLMRGLQSDEAITSFQTLSDNAQESMPAFGRGLAVIGRGIVRIGVNFSRYLPGLAEGFERWANGVFAVTENQDKLADMVDGNVESMRSLGRFTQSAMNFLIAFFGRGVEPGVGLLDQMAGGLDRWTKLIRENPEGLEKFFGDSVETTQDLWETIVPLAKLFMEWATIMRPFTTAMLAVTEAIGEVTEKIAAFGPIKNFITVAFGVFLAGSLAGKVYAVVGAMRALAGSVTAVGRASAGARIADFMTGGGLGFAARQQRKSGVKGGAATAPRGGGGVTRGDPLTGIVAGTASGKAKAGATSAVKGLFGTAVRGAGLFGLGIMASDILMKGLATGAKRSGGESTIRGVGQDFLSTVSFGLVRSADEESARAFPAMAEALRKNFNASFSGKIVDKGMWNSIYGEDLTGEQKKFLDRFRNSLREAAAIARDFNMPTMRADVKVDADPRDFQTLRENFSRLKNGLESNLTDMKAMSDQNLRAIAKTMGTQSNAGKRAVIENMDLTARSIGRSMKNGKTSATDGMRAIRETFKSNSRAAKETTATNFRLAKQAIQQAVRDGVMSSKRGTREIKRLWVENLQMYGLSPRQAKNIAATGDPDANKGRESGSQLNYPERKARGGLINVGTPGKRAHDNVPAMLNGQPSLIAEGEQVAVFNRHQQKAMNALLPGGLSGFFRGSRKPHHFAGGGIVPVPGFPGESAASSVIPMITMIARRFGLHLTDAFGQGHQSPGHTQTGTAADFSGPDAAMDAAVRFLVSKGYLVGYDGRFGSQDWPGHGPSTKTSNFHLHVELGGGALGGMVAPEIGRVLAPGADKLGAIGAAAQAVTDTMRGAANANLQAVASNFFAPTAGGLGGAVPGSGAATRSQMEAWARRALTVTSNLGHGGATPGNIAKILALAMKESSWIVDSINNWDSNAAAGNPSGGLMHVTIDKVGGSKAALFDPVTNMIASIVYQMARYKKLITFSPYAQGGIATDSKLSKRGGRVNRPRLLVGEEPTGETVISHNPAFRKSNIEYLMSAAKALGVPTARAGASGNSGRYEPKGGGGKRSSKAHRKNQRIIRTGGDPDNFSSVKRYGELQERETELQRLISIKESRLTEPESFIKQTGFDGVPIEGYPQGLPIYEIDQALVASYAWGLQEVVNLYNRLLDPENGVLAQMQRAAVQSFSLISNYIAARQNNIAVLDAEIEKNKALSQSKNKGTREKAIERLQKAREEKDEQKRKIEDARTTRKSLRDDQDDAKYRRMEYETERDSGVKDVAAVTGTAQQQLADKRDEVRQAGESVTDSADAGPTMQMQQLMADTERANILREFRGNFEGAVTGIAGATGGLQANLAGGLGSSLVTAGLAGAMTALSGGGVAQALSSGGAAGGILAGGGLKGMAGGAFGAGAVDNSNRSVTITNNFAAPPEDPMTWTRGVMFEAQAAV